MNYHTNNEPDGGNAGTGVSMMNSKAEIKCKVFEDHLGALNIATLPKIRPRTMYINIKYWHFREHLEQGILITSYILGLC